MIWLQVCQITPTAWRKATQWKGQTVSRTDMTLPWQNNSNSRLPCRLLNDARCLAKSIKLRENWHAGRRPVPDSLGTKAPLGFHSAVSCTVALFSFILFQVLLSDQFDYNSLCSVNSRVRHRVSDLTLWKSRLAQPGITFWVMPSHNLCYCCTSEGSWAWTMFRTQPKIQCRHYCLFYSSIALFGFG